ncbi:MAG: 16S rRNA (uracil(1498)-N(3))-methyltransferase [Bacteroidaceae bacterium]|nr:16S rRNA (uracil(1498)-N(3))-methyltransferase [Bacteroidaceae bacterium]
MKEVRFFYTPEPQTGLLPEEEAAHAVRVLRMIEGDELFLMDGRGTFYRAEITEASKHRCGYRIVETMPQLRQWKAHLHLAMGATKNMDRTEWFAEKATEIGFDELTFLDCRFSERRIVKNERIEKIMVAAMKQSRKAELPHLNAMMPFSEFIKRPFSGQKFICHCYEDNLPLLKDQLVSGEDAVVMIGPEGDFSIDEVQEAEAAGFRSVSLGKSRLRTETAALVAVHLMQLMNQ